MRIDKFLSQLKFCSRNEAKDFLKSHVVAVSNKRIMNPKDEINPEIFDVIIDGKIVYYKPEIHLMMYKPKGYLSANKDRLHPCAVNLLKDPYTRFDFSIAGRLDLDAEGLLVLTTSGTLVHEITSPKKHLPKVYEVKLDRPFIFDEKLLDGVIIKDAKDELYTAKALDLSISGDDVYITIDEGKFHQVKRMFLAVGYEVTYLKRVSIGNLKLGELKPGEYIEINKEQLYD
ncbi:MAG: hypothetical protein A2Y45_07375 [Tenericutes bacterium GWC2_34_14]|nr:MAG: hypothetical protein A2Y45_07375 [Tenericutes bacterium GWC2_34_14]OHE34707.1 MAG: hypothetical protein A2012_00985 [Tenericutes bacterium GWE2_34_108]OHE37432.1 MAG: hypothetical protein A2Y46_02025 [Tenericutes bacterium GWF1_35_14]OHE39433.1 MAG: hypothetical protein A2Y44_00835 [Tenericutes bacterium GWF2_35_184]OHE44377.1 MAG: hypothetical protein A2221_04675 [Tenericutes bacterium RIFOXYA2_FULL_36_32]OHE47196.1 MAG: hypothetical protein A2308_02985 [Tenericutes bacterium RIFOXYB2